MNFETLIRYGLYKMFLVASLIFFHEKVVDFIEISSRVPERSNPFWWGWGRALIR